MVLEKYTEKFGMHQGIIKFAETYNLVYLLRTKQEAYNMGIQESELVFRVNEIASFNESKEEALVWSAVAHYIYVLAVTIPFDIRDLKHDIPEQRTIPQVVGVRVSKFISIVLLLCFAMTILYFVEPFLLLNPWFFISIFVQIVLVLFRNEKRSDIYCAGMIDGSIALLGLSYFLC